MKYPRWMWVAAWAAEVAIVVVVWAMLLWLMSL